MRGVRLIFMLVGLLAVQCILPTRAAENLFEWMGLAENVVVATVQKADGRLTRFKVKSVIRTNSLEVGEEILADRWLANDQRIWGQPLLKFENDEEYLLLLRPAEDRRKKRYPLFEFVRGIEGARAIAPESGQALIQAVSTWAEIQEQGDEQQKWESLSNHLESKNPWLVETALAMHLKFYRGDQAQFATLAQLLSHPRPDVRILAAELIDQITDADPTATEQALLFDLPARLGALARVDEAVEVRVAALKAFAGLAPENTTTLLEEVSQGDPDQQVRLEAAKLLLDQKSTISVED